MPRRLRLVGKTAWLVLASAGVSLAACTPEQASEPPAAASRLIDTDVSYADGRALDVYGPPRVRRSLPVVVMVHGCCGDRTDLSKLAEAVAGAGAVVFNADWAGIRPGSHYPRAWEEVGCAVRFARARALAYGGDGSQVTLLAWSDGALAGAAVALVGDRLRTSRCMTPGPSAHPDRFVAVAGFFGWSTPVPAEYVNGRSTRFFGGTPAQARTAWHDASPYSWVSHCPALPFDLLVGGSDPLRADARAFTRALRRGGHRVRLVVVPPAGDQTLISPRTAEGQRVVSETLAGRAGSGPCAAR